MLVKVHPDVSRLTWRFGRWHHYVDYSPFRRNKLIRKPGLDIPDTVNEFGMVLVDRETAYPSCKQDGAQQCTA